MAYYSAKECAQLNSKIPPPQIPPKMPPKVGPVLVSSVETIFSTAGGSIRSNRKASKWEQIRIKFLVRFRKLNTFLSKTIDRRIGKSKACEPVRPLRAIENDRTFCSVLHSVNLDFQAWITNLRENCDKLASSKILDRVGK